MHINPLSNMNIVTVLLSTYNGERYIREQINSVLNQEGVSVNLIVRDDGSADGTIDILKQYQDKGLLNWYTGENLRPLGSFMHLLFNCATSDYYAFCDQDDVWLPNKLLMSVQKMKQIEARFCGKPVLIHTDMYVVDSTLNVMNRSFWDFNGIRPDILNNFVDLSCFNGVNGCTILMNNNARNVIQSNYFPQKHFIHDVMCTLLVAGNNGIIDYVDEPTMYYRQHDNNVVGAVSHSISYYLKRLKSMPSIIKDNIDAFRIVNNIQHVSVWAFAFHKVRYIFIKKTRN